MEPQNKNEFLVRSEQLPFECPTEFGMKKLWKVSINGGLFDGYFELWAMEQDSDDSCAFLLKSLTFLSQKNFGFLDAFRMFRQSLQYPLKTNVLMASSTNVAGVSYRQEWVEKIFHAFHASSCQIPPIARLRLEPFNIYDSKAVAVYARSGDGLMVKCGYIPSEKRAAYNLAEQYQICSFVTSIGKSKESGLYGMTVGTLYAQELGGSPLPSCSYYCYY